MKIHNIAETHDASIHTDKEGAIALLTRQYDEDGVKQVRHAPDPCDYHPLDEWEKLETEEAVKRWIA